MSQQHTPTASPQAPRAGSSKREDRGEIRPPKGVRPYTFLVFVLLCALIFVSVQWQRCATLPSSHQGKGTASAVYDNILSRTSIRAYTSESVSEEQIDSMLRAAMAAPSAANKQPWMFVVVTDREVLKRMAEANPYGQMVSSAPLAIAVCGNMKAAIEGEAAEMWVQDASAATQNLLLQAHAMGLGAVWTGVYPVARTMAAMKEALSLPAHIVPFSVIAIGHPAEQPKPKDKWDEGKVLRR